MYEIDIDTFRVTLYFSSGDSYTFHNVVEIIPKSNNRVEIIQRNMTRCTYSHVTSIVSEKEEQHVK